MGALRDEQHGGVGWGGRVGKEPGTASGRSPGPGAEGPCLVQSCELLPSPVASAGHGGVRANVSAVLPLPPSCRVSPSFLFMSLWLTLLSTYSAPGIVSIFFDPRHNPVKVSAPILQTRNLRDLPRESQL